MITLATPILEVPGIGTQFGQRLAAAGLTTVGGLLNNFPFRFEDFSATRPIADLKIGERQVIAATVKSATNERTPRRRMTITRALLQDPSGSTTAIWFNQPFLVRQLKPGSFWHFAGKLTLDRRSGKVFQVDSFERGSAIVPVYHETEGLTSKWLRHFIAKVLMACNQFKETLPQTILQDHHLIELGNAVYQIHKPASSNELARAKQRLAIEELLPMLLVGLTTRAELGKQRAPVIGINEPLLKRFVGSLPFKLTDDQRKAAWQILKDLAKAIPMNRLLQGEVGSGKTVVAAMAVLAVTKAGYQTLWLAPTDILANQHYQNVSRLLAPFDISVGLMTAGTKVNLGADLVIGTHALLQDDVQFPKVALVIVDEQHRFGVKQRAHLRRGSPSAARLRSASARYARQQFVPHFLSMTATPIPRTLSLTIWGDLELTVIEELPEERKQVVTQVTNPTKRQQAYQFVRDQVEQGRQVFVVTPLIGETDNRKQIGVVRAQPKLFQELERKSAVKEYDKLRKEIFPDLRIGLLHGKLSSKLKNRLMQDFSAHRLDILVSTAVVEVGIDVPNATVMMIEGAERFGLSQLHQLRGRVGRGSHQSYCLLLPDAAQAAEHQRLQVMTKTNSGLELAEYDLRSRGPGELLGTRQHGIPDFKMASLTDRKLIEQAQQIAHEVFDYGLDRLPGLGEKLAEFERVEHLE